MKKSKPAKTVAMGLKQSKPTLVMEGARPVIRIPLTAIEGGMSHEQHYTRWEAHGLAIEVAVMATRAITSVETKKK